MFAGPVPFPQALIELHKCHLGEATPLRLCRIPYVTQDLPGHKVVRLLHFLSRGWVCEITLMYMVNVCQAGAQLTYTSYILQRRKSL